MGGGNKPLHHRVILTKVGNVQCTIEAPRSNLGRQKQLPKRTGI